MVELHDARSRAAWVAACADLRDVRLFNVDSTLDRVPEGAGALSYSFDANIEVQYLVETAALIVDGTYDVRLTLLTAEGADDDEANSADDEAEGEQLAAIHFQLAALYAVSGPSEEPPDFPAEELDAFAQTTGLLALHPYAREFISDLTGRMGLPPLHIGTVRIPLDKRNDGED